MKIRFRHVCIGLIVFICAFIALIFFLHDKIISLEDKSATRPSMEEHRSQFFSFLNDVSETNIISYEYTYDANRRHACSSIAKVVLSENIDGKEILYNSFDKVEHHGDGSGWNEVIYDCLISDAHCWVSVSKPENELPTWLNPNKESDVYYTKINLEKTIESPENTLILRETRAYWYYPSENAFFMVAYSLRERPSELKNIETKEVAVQ